MLGIGISHLCLYLFSSVRLSLSPPLPRSEDADLGRVPFHRMSENNIDFWHSQNVTLVLRSFRVSLLSCGAFQDYFFLRSLASRGRNAPSPWPSPEHLVCHFDCSHTEAAHLNISPRTHYIQRLYLFLTDLKFFFFSSVLCPCHKQREFKGD